MNEPIIYICCDDEKGKPCMVRAVVKVKCVSFRKELCRRHAQRLQAEWLDKAATSPRHSILNMEWSQL